MTTKWQRFKIWLTKNIGCVTANAFDHKNDDNDGNQLNRNALNRSKKSRRSSSFASLWRKNPEQSIEEIRNRKRLSSRSKSMRNTDSIKRNDEEREEKFKNGKRSLSMRLEAAPYHHRSQINSNQKCSNVKPKSSVEEEKKNLDQTSVIGNDHLSSFEASIISKIENEIANLPFIDSSINNLAQSVAN
ncbi:sodium/potassium/calcium exchanger 4-like [Sarcoptes scabiei]|nr:sodium/potassium/calcium exchanger 4-like [Sarcoptes scabiei]